MKKNKIVYLILHYIAIDETIKCIEVIKEKNLNNDYEIVVVDNCSNNGSGEKILKKYKKDKNIHVIISNENLGFARGNNLGFKFAKEKINPDFIVMLNNDVYLSNDDFLEEIEKEYKESKFAVLGPKIYLKNNVVSNYPDKIKSIKHYKRQRRENKILYYFNKLNLRYIYSVIIKLKRLLKKDKKYNCDIRKEDVLLNGCCLIFSREYINKFDGIDDRTFLYYEEELLYLRLKNNNLKSVFNPSLKVFHIQGGSTNKKVKNKQKRFDFILKHEINSLNILIDELKNKGTK